MKVKSFASTPAIFLVLLVTRSSCQMTSSRGIFEKIQGKEIAKGPKGPIINRAFFRCDRVSCSHVVQLKNGEYKTVSGTAELMGIKNPACIWKKHSAPLPEVGKKVCNIEALGMESGKISDDKITASSQLNNNNAASKSRLNGVSFWMSSGSDVPWLQLNNVSKASPMVFVPENMHMHTNYEQEVMMKAMKVAHRLNVELNSLSFIKKSRNRQTPKPETQTNERNKHTTSSFFKKSYTPPAQALHAALQQKVDFGKQLSVTAIATQGSGGNNVWTTSYGIAYSNDAVNFRNIMQGSAIKSFNGNTNDYGIVKNDLPAPINARYLRFLRIQPKSYSWMFGLRVEIYGCEI